MISQADLKKRIAEFASTISKQPLGLAKHLPESWAQQTRCFENVIRKYQQDGGRGQSGWMFQHKTLADDDLLGYLIAIHHAVWHAPSGELIDVTPFHADPKHHPLAPGGDVLFLVDDATPPAITDRLMAPQPSRFFALGTEQRLVDHVNRLAQEERQACLRIYSQESPG